MTDRTIVIKKHPHGIGHEILCNVILSNDRFTNLLGLTVGEAKKLRDELDEILTGE